MALFSLTIDLDGLDADAVEDACFAAGAVSLSFSDQHDDPILEPAPGEFRLWPATRLQAIFDAAHREDAQGDDAQADVATSGRLLAAALADVLGIDAARLTSWCAQVGWKPLVNTRGTTWRKLTPEEQEITTQSKAVQLMQTYPSLIKRPVVETAGGHLLVGFEPATWASFVRNADE